MPFVRPFALLAAFAVSALPLHAEVSATAASGYLFLTVAAGTGMRATPSVLSFPFQGVANEAGQMKGLVTGVTANTITNVDAGWTAGALSQAATPYLLKVTSGNAAGRTFLLSTTTANSSTIVTLDATDALNTNLTALGITSTDVYQIVPADTLSEIFGTPASTGVLGSTTGPSNSDQVQLLQPGGWISYYYNTTSNHWLRASPPYTVADNVVIRPDTGVIYNRYATSAFSIMRAGLVPSVGRQAPISKSGPSGLSTGSPTDLTLGTSFIQTIPGWTSGAASNVADTVQVYSPTGGWSQYFYDGTNWRLGIAPNPVSDNVVLPAGSMVIINKIGTATGQTLLAQPLSYATVPSP